ASRIYSAVLQAGQDEGLDFNFAAMERQPNTFDSHRLIRWSASAGQQHVVVERLFQLYFMEGANIGDRRLLLQVAAECGLDVDLVRDLYERDADAEIVREEELVARRMGINGVPCFIIDRKYAVSGAQDPSVLAQVFDLAVRDHAEGPQAAE